MTESMEQMVRRIVREEIETALGRLALAASREDDYGTGEIESKAYHAIGRAANATVGLIKHTGPCDYLDGPSWADCTCGAAAEER